MEERRFIRIFLLLPSLLVLYFVYQIFKPFLMAIFLAIILATLSYPIYSWVLGRVRGRSNWAALITCLAIMAIIIVPFALLIVSLAAEANQVYQKFKVAADTQQMQQIYDNFKSQSYVQPLLALVDEYITLDPEWLIQRLTGVAEQVSLFLLANIRVFFSSIARLLTNFFLMIGTMFFLFRDGGKLVEQFKSWTPLSENYEERIIGTFQNVVSATVLGSLLTALAQGAAGGIVFWILGLPNALLWGSLMALFSLVPVVGTAIVWVPWVIYLLAVGSVVRAIILVVAALLFVGMIDNILRPLLIEGKAKMHTMLVFFSILGGISSFGLLGMILGPIIVALGLTFLELYKMEFKAELRKKGTARPEPSGE